MPAKTIITENQINYIKENYQSIGYRKCAEFTKLHPKKVREIGAKFGLTRPLNKPFNKLSNEQISIIINNYKILGPKKCSEMVGITEGHAGKIAAKFLIKKDRKYNYESLIANFTNITLPETAYVLGIIWADGTVNKHNVSINLVKEDMDNLEHIFDLVGEWGKHLFVSKHHSTWKPQKFLKACCSQLAKFFIEHDYKTKSTSSPTKILSKIPENLKHYFWRGYFDGDGCMYVKKKHIAFSFAGSFNQDWQECIKLMKKLKINNFSIRKRESKKGHKDSTFCIGSKFEMFKLANFLYPSVVFDGLGLERKFLKIKQACEIVLRQTSQYPNIFFIKTINKWASNVRASNKYILIGYFPSEIEAALARNEYVSKNKLDIPLLLI